MIRVALSALTLAAVVSLSVGAVIAQQNPIAERKDAMKTQGRAMYGVLNRMVRGQEPYDKAKVDAAFAQLAATSPKLKSLYPDTAKSPVPSNDDFSASAKVWENKADFDARIDTLVKTVSDNQSKAGDLDQLKVAYEAVNKVCTGCHEVYRVKNK
jgi:cytochrome c556